MNVRQATLINFQYQVTPSTYKWSSLTSAAAVKQKRFLFLEEPKCRCYVVKTGPKKTHLKFLPWFLSWGQLHIFWQGHSIGSFLFFSVFLLCFALRTFFTFYLICDVTKLLGMCSNVSLKSVFLLVIFASQILYDSKIRAMNFQIVSIGLVHSTNAKIS